MSDEREVHHEDETSIPEALHEMPEGIVFVEDEMARLYEGQPRMGKTNALDQILKDMIISGRSTRINVEPDPDLGARLDAKREEIEHDLPGVFPRMRYSEPQWIYGDRINDGSRFVPDRRGISVMDLKLRRVTPDWYPVRVGDVVRVIDVMRGERPVPGHVVDIQDWWIIVAGPLGRKVAFSGQTGFQAIEYRWRLEPYFEEESNR